jgi:hypothetical protein
VAEKSRGQGWPPAVIVFAGPCSTGPPAKASDLRQTPISWSSRPDDSTKFYDIDFALVLVLLFLPGVMFWIVSSLRDTPSQLLSFIFETLTALPYGTYNLLASFRERRAVYCLRLIVYFVKLRGRIYSPQDRMPVSHEDHFHLYYTASFGVPRRP